MNVKIGTNSVPQRDMNIREQNSKSQTTDPLSMKKQFGDKSLSQVLNEVADPNFKANERKVNGVGNPEMGKDAFFKLMLTQLKQQDPTNPLKSHEMAAQLAQFSSVEQLSNMNETLTKMSQGGSEQGKYDVLNLIGKMVSGDSSQIDRMKGDKEHAVEFTLPKMAENATLQIKDDKGLVVKKYDLKDLKEGKNQVMWNGLHDDGKEARVGHYRVEISATSQGQKVAADTKFSGPVDGVQFTAKGPVLLVDGKSLNLKDVKKIEISKDQNQSLGKNVINQNSVVSAGAIEDQGLKPNLDTAKMDQSLRSQIKGQAGVKRQQIN